MAHKNGVDTGHAEPIPTDAERLVVVSSTETSVAFEVLLSREFIDAVMDSGLGAFEKPYIAESIRSINGEVRSRRVRVTIEAI